MGMIKLYRNNRNVRDDNNDVSYGYVINNNDNIPDNHNNNDDNISRI